MILLVDNSRQSIFIQESLKIVNNMKRFYYLQFLWQLDKSALIWVTEVSIITKKVFSSTNKLQKYFKNFTSNDTSSASGNMKKKTVLQKFNNNNNK